MKKSKMFQRILALFLAVLMVISSNSLVYAMEDRINQEIVIENEELETASSEEVIGEAEIVTERESPAMFAVGDLNTGANGTLTRGQWLENLTIMFDMTIESEDLPDNYFSDLTEESEYYETVMLAVEFGVIDIEAGEALNLDDPCTRDFAAKTLNYCLGFQLEEGTSYSFSDSEHCSNADSAQVAVNRGWFSLNDGQFLPEKTVTAEEINVMINDTEEVLESSYVEEGFESDYVFADYVVEVAPGTEVDIDENDVVTITGAEEIIEEGDTFVVYPGNLPSLYMAEDVTINGDVMIIETADADETSAVVSIDSSGTVDVDLSQFEEADGVSATFIETEEQASEVAETFGISVHQDSIVASQDIPLGAGVKASIVVNLSNLKLKQDINTFNNNYYVTVTGTSTITTSVSMDMLEAAGWNKSVTLGTVRVLGVGKVTVSVDLNLSGKATATYTGTFESGFQYRPASGFRLVTSFQKKNFSTEVQANAKVGVKVSFSVDLIVVNGTIYATTGMAGKFVSKTYGDGNAPDKCTNISAWLYTTVGAYAKLGVGQLSKSYSKTLEIFNEKNSPVYVSFHWEDSVKVHSCSRGDSYKYFTRDSSPYGCSYYGGARSEGIGSNGEPFTIFEYTLDEDENATLTSYKGNVSALYIPETIDGYTVTGIGETAFRENKSIRSVVIPETVTKIGATAFYNCTNLNYVKLPENLSGIGAWAFLDCDSLVSVNIPAKITEIYSTFYKNNWRYGAVFGGCDSLKNVTFSEGITSIGRFLEGCTGIEELVIPDTVTSIEACAFESCVNLRKVTIPNSVTAIQSCAFGNCSSLAEIQLPTKLKVLGSTTFYNCDSLESINIPSEIEEIPHTQNYDYPGLSYGAVFLECDNLKEIKFDKGITRILKILNRCTSIEKIEIPDTVTSIGDAAFEDCSALKEVVIPNSVTAIESSAFGNCVSLENVKLPEKLKTLGSSAFHNCDGLESILIPATVENVPYTQNYDYPWLTYGAVFRECDNLKTVVFEEGTKTIFRILNSCYSLEKIEIPDTVTQINDNAFYKCTNLKEVILSRNVETIGASAFESTAIETIVVPDSVKSLGGSVFANCNSLLKITIPDTVQTMGESSFKNCTSLKEIKLSNSLKEIPASMFEACSALESFALPDSVETIGSNSFRDCTTLKEVIWNKNIKKINNSVFRNCDELQSIIIPDTISSLGTELFYDSDALKDVKLGTGITSIPASSFEHCDSLETMVLPYRVTSIGANAFKNCTNLTAITIPRLTISIDGSAFSYPDKITIYGVAGTYAEEFANENDITFVNREVKATEVKFEQETLEVHKGTKCALVIKIAPDDFTDKVSWKTTNEEIVTVDENGNIYAKGVGTATIKVTVGSVSASCKITVVQPVTSVDIHQRDVEMNGIKTYQLEVSVYPDNAYKKEVVWSSSDESIVTVDQNGLVTVVNLGEADIIATATDGSGKSDKCHVTVKDTIHYVDSVDKLESPHNYPNNFDDTWIYTLDGAENVWVTFDAQTEIEDGFDYLYIYDGNNREVGKYTGTELAGKTISVPGNTVKIKLVSDDGGDAWGFKVTSVETTDNGGKPTPEETPEVTPEETPEVTPEETPEVTPDVTPEETPEVTPEETPEVTPTPESKGEVSEVFSDIKQGAWYEAGIQYVFDKELMNGSGDKFNPTKDISRAQLVTTLYRLAGSPKVTDTRALTDFSDVAEGKYYTDAVCWAYAEGIANGNNGKFDPTGNLTRQQMAAFFYRFAEYEGIDTAVRGDISSMLNADKVSGYAKDSVEWAVGAGLISGSKTTDANGKEVYDLKPRDNTTRAQVAAILQRFCEGNNL